jgi:hypothetical protein
MIPRENLDSLVVLIGGHSKYDFEIFYTLGNKTLQLFTLADVRNPQFGPKSLLDVTAIAVRGLILIAGGGQEVFAFLNYALCKKINCCSRF